ncbi:MAG: hypothetical protein H6702_24945 [Myxococcales bacterium]|nr:hypothetical protein [Myxococcales bacterium]
MSALKVLMVGAGAVGQTYGFHLLRGGAELTFYVRPGKVAGLRGGVVVHPLNLSRAPRRLEGYAVVSDAAQVATAGPFDVVILTVPSDALRGAWCTDLLAAAGPDATVVALQPGPQDQQWVADQVGAERVVAGLIALLAWFAPLPGVDRAPGVAWWRPPFGKLPFSGAPARVQPLVQTLRKGGMPAKAVPDAAQAGAAASAVMMPFIAALESVGWQLARLPEPEPHGLALGAAREIRALVAPKASDLPLKIMGRRGLLRVGLRVARWFMPMDLQTYTQAHFTKVGAQTRFMFARYVELARERGLAADHVQGLLDRLAALDAKRAPTG